VGRLDGKVAVITGAARGMGASHAAVFVAEGARVVLTDVLAEEGTALAERLGPSATFVCHDVGDEHGWREVIGLAKSAYGKLDILVNNAGIVVRELTEKLSLADYERVLRVNQIGPFLGIRTAIPALREAGGGSIVNVSSINGLRGTAGTVAYSSSKYALRGITQTVALEVVADGIRVNTVLPGNTTTHMTTDSLSAEAAAAAEAQAAKVIPMGRHARAAEISQLVLFLASDESSYITGAEYVIDGGWSARLAIPEEWDITHSHEAAAAATPAVS